MFIGVLILLNTFASDVIFSIALPLIIFWRKQTSSSQTSGEENRNRTGEFVYHDYPTKLRCDMFRVHGMYQVCKGFKVGHIMQASNIVKSRRTPYNERVYASCKLTCFSRNCIRLISRRA